MKKIFLVLFFCMQTAAHESLWEPGIESDSGIYGPKYAKIVEQLYDLKVQYSNLVRIIEYGQTPQGRKLVGIQISKFSTQRTQFDRKAILIAGSIHGNEYLNIEDRLPEWFLTEGITKPSIAEFFNEGGTLYIIPILNPDGYDARKRENSHGKDLNRDFTVRRANYFGFHQPETTRLSEFIASELQSSNQRLVLTMDYHCCIGAVLRPWSFRTDDPPTEDLARFNAVGNVLRSVFGRTYQYGTTPNILGYEAIGTSKDYYYETYGALAFTFEGRKGIENRKLQEHTLLWEQLIGLIN